MKRWLKNLSLSLLFGILAGILGYLIARGISSAYLLYESQDMLRGTVVSLREGGVMALATSNVRDMRAVIKAREAYYLHRSLLIALGMAGCASIGSYVWMEWRTTGKGR